MTGYAHQNETEACAQKRATPAHARQTVELRTALATTVRLVWICGDHAAKLESATCHQLPVNGKIGFCSPWHVAGSAGLGEVDGPHARVGEPNDVLPLLRCDHVLLPARQTTQTDRATGGAEARGKARSAQAARPERVRGPMCRDGRGDVVPRLEDYDERVGVVVVGAEGVFVRR